MFRINQEIYFKNDDLKQTSAPYGRWPKEIIKGQLTVLQ